MTQYSYAIGASPNTKTVTGNLGWNSNGTLDTLGINDQLNSTNNQTETCNYGYDDLARIASANCGSIWSQIFGYDAFGNLSKSGSVSFQPTYNTATNRVSTVGGQSFTYDANGNTLSDTVHTYTWDNDNRPTSIGGVSLTYDAFQRMVESGTTQIVYSVDGSKLAVMNGQSLSKAFVPLPAGAVAVYGSGWTLSYYRHPDWLGSSRLSTTPSRTVYSSLAYAPFGETYAESGTPDRSFTGQNQDTIQGGTAGLYDFTFREYAQYGRWISPDPAGRKAVSLRNPQTWNRYAYVANNPLTASDLSGLMMSQGCTPFTCGDGGAGVAQFLAGYDAFFNEQRLGSVGNVGAWIDSESAAIQEQIDTERVTVEYSGPGLLIAGQLQQGSPQLDSSGKPVFIPMPYPLPPAQLVMTDAALQSTGATLYTYQVVDSFGNPICCVSLQEHVETIVGLPIVQQPNYVYRRNGSFEDWVGPLVTPTSNQNSNTVGIQTFLAKTFLGTFQLSTTIRQSTTISNGNVNVNVTFIVP